MEQGTLRSGTMYDRVTDRLRDEITSGLLPTNTRLKAPDLATRLGVSPSPVREALQKLQAEGLIVLKPNHGAIVRGVSHAEFVHMMRLRAAIEGMQAGICASIATKALLGRIKSAAKRFAAAVKNNDRDKRIKANAQFHHLILSCDGSEIAPEIVGRVQAVTASLRRQYVHSDARLERGVDEHFAIFAAIADGDCETADRLARAHVIVTLEDIATRIIDKSKI